MVNRAFHKMLNLAK